ncbi:MAG: hypothetical protein M1821_006867 [Bathelium mastoideum]|nr:MAG: hypothetical protein M1821_006867 [Bathelium mastoideum]
MAKRTNSPALTTNTALGGRKVLQQETPRLRKQSSIQALSSRRPVYNKFNPSPADWPKPETVHRMDEKNRSRLQKPGENMPSGNNSKSSSSRQPAEVPKIPPLPAFHPLYPNPHLEPCTTGGLTHVLDCGHKVITPKCPESCAKNCDFDHEKLNHVDRTPQKAKAPTTEAFCCMQCISTLLDKKYTKKYMAFLSEIQSIKVKMGYLPEGLVERRREALQRVWTKERDADWMSLTFYGRRCEPINTDIEVSYDAHSILEEQYHAERPSVAEGGSSLDEGVQLTYRQLLDKFPGAPGPQKDTVQMVELINLVDEEDHRWITVDERFKRASADILKLASQIHDSEQAQLRKPPGALTRLLFNRSSMANRVK